MRHQSRRLALPIFAGILFLAPTAYAGTGQTRPVEIQGILGHSAFVDESYIHHIVAGGSLRFHLTRRLAIEPELLYMRESGADQDLVFLPNLVWEFRGTGARARPYLIGGVGLLRHRGLTGSGFFSSTSVFGSGGIGIRARVSDRLFISPEFRIGFEPMIQTTVKIGYIWKR